MAAVIILGILTIAFAFSDHTLILRGSSDYAPIFKVNSAFLKMDAEKVNIHSDVVVFRYVKEIRKENDGEIIHLNGSHMQVDYKSNYFFSVNNATVNIYMNKPTSIENSRSYSRVNGYEDYYNMEAIRSNDIISILPSQVNRVLLGGKEISDFDKIDVEMGTGYLDLPEGNITFYAYHTSNTIIESQNITSAYIRDFEGTLRIDGKRYAIENTNYVQLQLDPNSDQSLVVDNNNVFLDSNVEYASIDDNSIIEIWPLYWFNHDIDKINSLATIVLVAVTYLYAKDNRTMVKENKKIQDTLYIHKRLQLFYYPLQSAVESIITQKEYRGGFSPINDDNNYYSCLSSLEKFVEYQYLASLELKQLFNELLTKMYLYQDKSLSLNLKTLSSQTTDDDEIIEIRSKVLACLTNEITMLESRLEKIQETYQS
ncbi:hypothetical protein SAMN04488589_1164 [Methanolobus vulcani]|uniref:Uncharacterized protein n=1 Tax=Methanolobus vulcani TaxID=38026 RepID=A0A7Z7B164_9EURY|nr:hypothetical protein SAMN04488589_1164 [Methanolobus vulcani]